MFNRLTKTFDQNLLFRVGIFLALGLLIAAIVFIVKEKGGYASPLVGKILNPNF